MTGAGGFIGHHLVKCLKKKGYWVRGVDIKNPQYEKTSADEFLLLDLRKKEAGIEATKDVEDVYALACDMGGMGFISCNDALIFHNNMLIDINTIEGAHKNKVKKYLFSSSGCVYPAHKQNVINIRPLKEEDAFPANPADGAYSWEKLITEKMCEYYRNDYGLNTKVVRLHNVFGPLGTWDGGREKVPAAICRKVAVAKLSGNHEIEVWGDGMQTRSFCYIDDCIEGIYRLMNSKSNGPLNLGQDRMININDLVKIIVKIAKIGIKIKHIKGPQGVRGRNSDNSLLKKTLNWEPSVTLEKGLTKTYAWIEEQIKKSRRYA